MTDFKLHTADTAPEGARDTLKGIEQQFGFVPNLFGKMAESPQALDGYLALNDLFEKTGFSPAEQQVALIAISVENECEFCVSVHSFLAKNQAGVDEGVVDALREGESLPDEKLDALARFVRHVVRQRGWVDDAELERFLAAGYEKRQVLDVILANALKTLSNYTNHIAGTPLNEQFESERWKAPGNRAA